MPNTKTDLESDPESTIESGSVESTNKCAYRFCSKPAKQPAGSGRGGKNQAVYCSPRCKTEAFYLRRAQQLLEEGKLDTTCLRK